MFQWFKNLKISLKLIVSFLIISIITGLLGTVSTMILIQQKNDNEYLFVKYGNSQGHLGYVLEEFQKQRMLYTNMIMLQNLDETKAIATQIEDSDQKLNLHLAEYGKTAQSKSEKSAFEELKIKIQAFDDFKTGIINSCLNENYGMASIVAASSGTGMIADDVSTYIENAVAKNVETAQIKMKEQNAAITLSIIIMAGVVVVAVALSILLGLFISRLISKPIQKVSDAAEKTGYGRNQYRIGHAVKR